MTKHIPEARIARMTTKELEAIIDDDLNYDEETWLAADDELDRREYDDEDPASDYDRDGGLKEDSR